MNSVKEKTAVQQKEEALMKARIAGYKNRIEAMHDSLAGDTAAGLMVSAVELANEIGDFAVAIRERNAYVYSILFAVADTLRTRFAHNCRVGNLVAARNLLSEIDDNLDHALRA